MCRQKLYFKIGLFICIKMDLVLNTQQGLICDKTQTNKQTGENRWGLHKDDVYCFEQILEAA